MNSEAGLEEETGLEEIEKKWRPLANLFAISPQFTDLSFDGPDQVPVILLDALRKHNPEARLHVRNWARNRYDDDHNDPAELALARSPNLRSIRAKLWPSYPGLGDTQFAALKRIIAMSPSLELVDVRKDDEDDVGYDLDPVGITKSKLFEVADPSPNAIESLRRGVNLTLEDLENATDLSKLESLDTPLSRSRGIFGVSSHKFQSLKHLTIRFDYDVVVDYLQLQGFLESYKPLEGLHLHIHVKKLSWVPILARHGLTSRSFTIPVPEMRGPIAPLSPSQINSIRRACPYLSDLTIDVRCTEDGTYEREVLSCLARFPHLSIIRIQFEIECNYTNKLFPPEWMVTTPPKASYFEKGPAAKSLCKFANSGLLEKIWSVLRQEKRAYGTPAIEELHVEIGNWNYDATNWDYSIETLMQMEKISKHHLVVKPSERDDRPDEIRVFALDREHRDESPTADMMWDTRWVVDEVVDGVELEKGDSIKPRRGDEWHQEEQEQ